MSTCAFVESGVAAALKSLDRALDAEGEMDAALRREVLLAYEQLRGVTELIEVERNIAAARANAERDNPPAKAPLRLVRR